MEKKTPKFKWSDEAVVAYTQAYAGNDVYLRKLGLKENYRGLKQAEKMQVFKQDWVTREKNLDPMKSLQQLLKIMRKVDNGKPLTTQDRAFIAVIKGLHA